MGVVQPITISDVVITSFEIPFIRPFTFTDTTVSLRVGFYIELILTNGIKSVGEIAPLPGISPETLKKAKHDLDVVKSYLLNWAVPLTCKELVLKISTDEQINALCPSVRFGIESALFSLAAQMDGVSLAKYLGADNIYVDSAVLLQGTHEQMMAEAKEAKAAGAFVYKLKVGNRNIPLDVKNVQDLRQLIGKEGSIRLDANRVWSFSEAVLFAQLAGHGQIEFIEEPLSDPSRLNEFYQAAHLPIALDETLAVLRCNVTAPGRCSPTLAMNEGVKAFIIKPTVLGGVIAALNWIEEARRLGKKAIISSSFETKVGNQMLSVLAGLSGQTSGLGTQRWLKQ